MQVNFSFNKEKVKKECKKLIRISNLGEKTLQGYINGNGFNPKDYSIIELAFLEEVAKKLQPSTYSMVDVFEVDRLLSYYKNQILYLFEDRTINYIMSDEERWCAEQFDSFEAIRNERLYLVDFYKFVTEKFGELIPVLANLPLEIYADYQFCQGLPYNFMTYFMCQSFSAPDTESAFDLLCGCITKWVVSSLPLVFPPESEFDNSQIILKKIISSPAYMREFIKASNFCFALEQIADSRKNLFA